MNRSLDQMQRPERSFTERMREKCGVLTLVAAAAGLVAELTPAEAQAQVIEQQTVRSEVAPPELAATKATAEQSIAAMSVPSNAFTRTHQPAYQSELTARMSTTGPMQVTQRNLLPEHDPVRWLEAGTFYVTLQSGAEAFVVRPTTIGDSEYAPNIPPENRTDQPIAREGLTRMVLTAFQTTSLNTECSVASRRPENGGHFSAPGVGMTSDAAVMDALQRLVSQHGTGQTTTRNLISGDFHTNTSQVLRLQRTTAEAGLSHMHIDVSQGTDGVFHANVSADVSVVLVFDPV